MPHGDHRQPRARLAWWRQVLLLGLAVLLAACGSAPLAALPPTPQVFDLYYPTALKPLENQLASCAKQTPAAAIFFHEENDPIAPPTNGFALQLGEQSIPPGAFATQVGTQQIVLVVNAQNSTLRLTTAQVRQLFDGETQSWFGDLARPVSAWAYATHDPLRILFDGRLTGGIISNSRLKLASSPQEMLEAIAADENGIGYLPSGYIDGQAHPALRVISLEPDLAAQLTQPILAVSAAEPQGSLRELLVCLQP